MRFSLTAVSQGPEEFRVNKQGCALAEPGDPWGLTFAAGRLENLRFFIQII